MTAVRSRGAAPASARRRSRPGNDRLPKAASPARRNSRRDALDRFMAAGWNIEAIGLPTGWEGKGSGTHQPRNLSSNVPVADLAEKNSSEDSGAATEEDHCSGLF